MVGRALLIWSSTIIVAVNVPNMVGFVGKGDNAGKSEAVVASSATLASTPVEDGRNYVLKANDSGHFAGRFRLNGKTVDSMIDTGATFVTMSESMARNLGYGGNELRFRYEVVTANGRVKAARISLKTVEIGTVSVRNVDAMVIRGQGVGQPLIGMSFLKRLSGYRAENDELKLIN